MGYLFPWQTGC
jgi:uncharacterized membrane protein YeaQ/YmgE (transglycosylase-associated protein family)